MKKLAKVLPVVEFALGVLLLVVEVHELVNRRNEVEAE